VNKFLKILSDGNPQKVPRMGTLSGIGHPFFSRPPFHSGNAHRPHWRGPGPPSLVRCYGLTHRSINSGVPFGKGMGVFWRAGRVLHGREPRGVVGSPGHARDSQPWWRNHSSRPECRTGFAARRAAAKGKTATLFRQRLGIRLDENLDGLFAGINLDTIRRAAKVDLVASSVRSSNDGV
jgi:hypothetical protein